VLDPRLIVIQLGLAGFAKNRISGAAGLLVREIQLADLAKPNDVAELVMA
jgi:hypothetical protein